MIWGLINDMGIWTFACGLTDQGLINDIRIDK